MHLTLIEDGKPTRYALTLARNGQILSSTEDRSRAAEFGVGAVDAAYTFYRLLPDHERPDYDVIAVDPESGQTREEQDTEMLIDLIKGAAEQRKTLQGEVA